LQFVLSSHPSHELSNLSYLVNFSHYIIFHLKHSADFYSIPFLQ